MNIHPRHEAREMASREIAEAVHAIVKKHNLTLAEELAMLGEVLSNKLYLCRKHERTSKRRKT